MHILEPLPLFLNSSVELSIERRHIAATKKTLIKTHSMMMLDGYPFMWPMHSMMMMTSIGLMSGCCPMSSMNMLQLRNANSEQKITAFMNGDLRGSIYKKHMLFNKYQKMQNPFGHLQKTT